MAEETKKTEEEKVDLELKAAQEADEKEKAKTLRNYYNDKEKLWGSYSGRYRAVLADEKGEGTYNNPDSDFTYKGGFYYDSQLEDPYLSISLHANTKLNENGEWVEWPGKHLEPIYTNEEKDKINWSKKYGVDPIARSILSEDFSYSITNNFSDYNGGNPIEEIFNNFKPYAPILEKFGTNLGNASNNFDTMGSDIVKWFTEKAQSVSKLAKSTSGYLNKALFVQGTRFSYYNGTQFNFNNMEMRFIAFSDYVLQNGSWVFQSVEDYIKTLQPYVMGIYSKYSNSFLYETGDNSWTDEFKKNIKEYVGFQDPPGGFTMDTKSLDNTLKGTLRMNIGGTWAIENLVLKNMNVNMSKVQAKHPEKPGETVPLYAEIVLQLSPASVLVDTGYRKTLDHKGMTYIRKGISKGYENKLNSLKKSYIKEK